MLESHMTPYHAAAPTAGGVVSEKSSLPIACNNGAAFGEDVLQIIILYQVAVALVEAESVEPVN